MPMATLMAAADHASVSGATAELDPEADLRALAEAGIDLDDVTAQLLREGVEKFVEPFEKLFDVIESRREAIFMSRPPTVLGSIPDEIEPRIAAGVANARSADVAHRVWKKDETLWGAAGEARDRRPARLADRGGPDARGRRRPRGVRGRGPGRGHDRRRAARAWAARRSRPR